MQVLTWFYQTLELGENDNLRQSASSNVWLLIWSDLQELIDQTWIHLTHRQNRNLLNEDNLVLQGLTNWVFKNLLEKLLALPESINDNFLVKNRIKLLFDVKEHSTKRWQELSSLLYQKLENYCRFCAINLFSLKEQYSE